MTLGSSKAYESICVSFLIKNLEIKLKFTDFFFLKIITPVVFTLAPCLLIPRIFNTHLLERQIYSAQIYLSGWGQCPLPFRICEQYVIVVGTSVRSLQLNVPPPLNRKCLPGVLSQVLRFIVLWRMKYLWCFIMWGCLSHNMYT